MDFKQAYKNKLLETYDFTVKFLDSHGLQWWGAYGTVLGAVRHKGLIPWDDDIDLYMPRADYEKLFALRREIQLQSYDIKSSLNKEYVNSFIKICNQSTSLVANKDYMYDEGVFIDIFPLDVSDEIDFDSLPNQFVLKCTHDSGGVVVCKDKTKLNISSTKKKLKKSLKRDFFWRSREWPYKNVKPRIIAEKYMVDESGYELKDYKFFCFEGKCRFFKIDFDRYTDHHANYYDCNAKLLPFGEADLPPVPSKVLDIPSNLKEMVDIAEKLARDIKSPFVRIDLYNIDGKIFFGEITFYPASGFGKIIPHEWDVKLGDWITLQVK